MNSEEGFHRIHESQSAFINEVAIGPAGNG